MHQRTARAGPRPSHPQGRHGAKDRAAALARLTPQPGGPALLAVATGPYAGEGFDCPLLDTPEEMSKLVRWGRALSVPAGLTHKQQHAPLPGAAVLLCPWVRLGIRPDEPRTGIAAPLASADEARLCATAYLAGHATDDPVIAPLSADLAGLPRMLIQASTGDARLADATAMAAHARDHGVDVRLELYPVDAHAFQLFWSFLPEAADAIEAVGVFIRETRSEGNHRAGRTHEDARPDPAAHVKPEHAASAARPWLPQVQRCKSN